MLLRNHPARLAIALGLLATPGLAAACSTCGCSLNSDWAAQGYAVSRGWHLNLRQDYFNQSRLYSGTERVARDSFDFPVDDEVQRKTINRNTLLTADYNINRYWGLSVVLPYFDRYHETVAEGDTAISTSDGRGIGDIRVLARYQGFSPDAGLGLQFGLKLPTGSFKQTFQSGPQAGELLDRGLQRGTGTTNALLGLYKFGHLTPSLGYFAQAMAELPLDSRDGFRPGNSLNADFGLRYLDAGRWTPQLQLNLHGEQRERGALADRANSGADWAYLSPGLAVSLGKRLEAYAFVQFPVYQRVNGLQIEPGRLWSAGLSYRF